MYIYIIHVYSYLLKFLFCENILSVYEIICFLQWGTSEGSLLGGSTDPPSSWEIPASTLVESGSTMVHLWKSCTYVYIYYIWLKFGYIYICRGWNRVWTIVLDMETHRSIFKKGMEIPQKKQKKTSRPPLGCGSGWLGAWDDGNAPFFPPSLGRYWGTILDNPVNIGQTQMEFI